MSIAIKDYIRKSFIESTIQKEGSAYKAAKAFKISPQALYEQMQRLDIPRKSYLLSGEPKDLASKKVWLEEMLSKYPVKTIAKQLCSSPTAIRRRMLDCGIKSKAVVAIRCEQCCSACGRELEAGRCLNGCDATNVHGVTMI